MIRPEGTYCGDPDAKFTVSSASKEDGCGIQGYYVTEMTAYQMKRWCLWRGHTNVSVAPYSRDDARSGIHPLVTAMMNDYV